MKLVKVVKVVEPEDKERGIYSVYIKDGNSSYRADKSAAMYREFVAEQTLLRAGADAKLLDEYYWLVIERYQDDESYNND